MKFTVDQATTSMELFYDDKGQSVSQENIDKLFDALIGKVNKLSDEQIEKLCNEVKISPVSSKEYLSKLPNIVKQSFDFWKARFAPAFKLLNALTAKDIVDDTAKWKEFIEAAKSTLGNVTYKKINGSDVFIPTWSSDLSKMLIEAHNVEPGADGKKSMYDLGYKSVNDLVIMINAAICMFSTKGTLIKSSREIAAIMNLPHVKTLVVDMKKLEGQWEGNEDDYEYGINHYGPLAFLYEEFGNCATMDVQQTLYEASFFLESDIDSFIKGLDITGSSSSIWKKILKIFLFPLYTMH